MVTRAFAFLDTAIAVESTDEPTLDWLDEVLRPWFDGPPAERELDVILRHRRTRGGSRPDRLASTETLPFLRLDSRVIRLPATREGSRVVLDDVEEGCRYTVDGLDVGVHAFDNAGRLVLLRIIRELAVEHERRHARSVELHAAALELDGQAIVLAGPKGSGKTTLLLQALTLQPARLIANDRVLVDGDTGRPRVRGIPAVIRVRPKTAATFPVLAAGLPRTTDLAEMTLGEAERAFSAHGPAEIGSELRLSAAQLARALPASLRASATLRAVVFPEIGAGAHAPQLSRLAPAEALERLRASVYGGHGDADVATVLTEVIARACPTARTAEEVRAARAALMARLAADVPCFLSLPAIGSRPRSISSCATCGPDRGTIIMTIDPTLVELEQDAGDLLVSLGAPVVRAEVISPLRSATARKCCHRLELADGRTLKLRRSSSEPEARLYAELVTALGDRRLARVLDRRGDVTLEEWIPGTPLADADARDVSETHLTAGADLLGTLHATRRLGTTVWPAAVSTRPVRDQLEDDLREVLALEALDAEAGAKLRDGAERHDPRTARPGVIHTDLCPENLVIDTGGVLRAVDNEGLRIGALGFDLARVWYRWPMSDASWRTYLDAYARRADPTPELEHFPFWQIAAVLQSVRLRLTRRTPQADLPVRRLAALAAQL